MGPAVGGEVGEAAAESSGEAVAGGVGDPLADGPCGCGADVVVGESPTEALVGSGSREVASGVRRKPPDDRSTRRTIADATTDDGRSQRDRDADGRTGGTSAFAEEGDSSGPTPSGSGPSGDVVGDDPVEGPCTGL